MVLAGELGLAVSCSDATRFLVSLQHAGGGILAHATAGTPDLLSSFTVAVAGWAMPAWPPGLRRAGLARFAVSLARPDGGFGGVPGDPEPDVEYTYYGVALLTLLAACHSSGPPSPASAMVASGSRSASPSRPS